MSAAGEPHGGDAAVLRLWVALVIAITVGGVGWMWSTGQEASKVSVPVVLVAWSPSLAAAIAVTLLRGRAGLARLTRPLLVARLPGRVWLVVLALPVCLVLLALALYRFGGGHPGAWVDASALVPGLGAILAGALGEELGWRGLAQPVIARRRSVLAAGVIVGLLWATWHCWSLVTPGHGGDVAIDVATTYVRLTSTAVLYGWVLAASEGSLLAVVLAHAAHNVAVTAMPAPDDAPVLVMLLGGLYLLAATVLCVVDGPRMLVTDEPSPTTGPD